MLREKWADDLAQRFDITADIVGVGTLIKRLELATQRPRHAFALIASLEGLRTPADFHSDEGTSSKAELARILDHNNASADFALFDLVIIDEAHYLRNPGTASNRLGRLLRDAARNMVLLTATPIQIDSDNLYQLLRLVDEDQFFHSQADCHAVPEIVAGITSFLGSRDARPGRYAYFDIGGGTVDGVLLGYNRYDGSPRTHCYAGKVESLGVASLAYRAYGEAGHRMERAIAGGAPRSEVDSRLRPFENDLHTLVAKVIVDGWSKDAGALSGLADQELPVFVGGGGAQSAWYRRNIRGAYDSRQHRNVGIPPYRITEVPRPTDLNYQFSGDVQFSRFAVAYGLSVPYEEISGFDLPRRSRRRSRDNMERKHRNDVIPFERFGAVYG